MEHIDKAIPDFSQYILGDKPLNFEKYFYLISENSFNSNSTAFIGSLLAYYLKNNFKIIFCGCNEGLNHYNSISKRYGINLLNNKDIYYVDLFYSPYKSIIKEELPLGEIFPYTFNSLRSKNYYLLNNFYSESSENSQDSPIINDLKLTELLEKIILENNLNTNEKTIIVFDNISVLPLKDLKEFVNKIYNISIINNFYTLIGVNRTILNSGDQIYDAKRRCYVSSKNEDYAYLSHLADLEFEFIENESGYSKDIDGKINIKVNSSSLENNWNLIYKIKENCIEFYTNLVV